jgi:hypothetical protein
MKLYSWKINNLLKEIYSKGHKERLWIPLVELTKLPTKTVGDKLTYQVKHPQLSERCILVESTPARQILTDHFITGPPLVLKSRQAVKDCLSVFFALNARNAEIVPLSGSLTYDVLNSYYELYNHSLFRNFIGIKRYQRPDGRWGTNVSYTNLEGLTENLQVVFIGDTIATGVTMTKVIQMVQAQLQTPVTFVIMSIAGSLTGAKHIVKLEKDFSQQFPGTAIWCLFTEAYFGLEANGTDMPIHHPDTISTNQLHDQSKLKLGSYLSRNLCSVLDWGKRTNAPLKYYKELFEKITYFPYVKLRLNIVYRMVGFK